MSQAKAFGKSILLLILIAILSIVGLLWFDYLGLIQAKHIFSPVYRLAGLQPQVSTSASSPSNMEELDLDNDRYRKRLEALDVRVEELDKRESDIKKQEENNTQIAQELEDRQIAQEEREKTFNLEVKKYDDRNRNIEQIVSNLRGMQPANAVAILSDMDDQDIIDILRKEVAQYGASSMGSFWLSMMESKRAAEVQRKMTNKPTTLD